MSGRSQHYLPQFLQRGFAKRRNARDFQITVANRTKIFSTNTQNIGAERDFYYNTEYPSVDDRVTTSENTLAVTLQSIKNRENVDPELVRQLVISISMRTKVMRQVLRDLSPVIRDMMDRYTASKAILIKTLRGQFLDKKEFNNNFEKNFLASNFPPGARRYVRRKAWQKWQKDWRVNQDKQLADFQNLLHLAIEEMSQKFEDIADTSFAKALQEDPLLGTRCSNTQL